MNPTRLQAKARQQNLAHIGKRCTVGGYNALQEISNWEPEDFYTVAMRAGELAQGNDITRAHVEQAIREAMTA